VTAAAAAMQASSGDSAVFLGNFHTGVYPEFFHFGFSVAFTPMGCPGTVRKEVVNDFVSSVWKDMEQLGKKTEK